MNTQYSGNQAVATKNDNTIKFEDFQNSNTNRTVKPEKFSIKMIFAFLRRKAKKILKSKEEVRNLVTKALEFVKKLGNISFLKKWFVDIPTVCDMMIDVINGKYKNFPYSSLVAITIAIVYVVSPIDLIADAFPVLGVADDAMVFKIVLDTIKNDLESYNTWKASQTVA